MKRTGADTGTPVLDRMAVVAPAADAAWTDLAGQTAVLDQRRGALHLLNPTASLVWGLLDGTTALQDLAADIAAAFEAPPDLVCADLVALANDLATAGLLAGFEAPAEEPGPAPADTPGVLPEPPNG